MTQSPSDTAAKLDMVRIWAQRKRADADEDLLDDDEETALGMIEFLLRVLDKGY